MSFVPPNESELEAVSRLKGRLFAQFGADDTTTNNFSDTKLLRFYRGMKLNEDNAFDSLIKHRQWMVDEEVSTVQDKKAIFEKEYSANKVIILDGLDVNSRPVSVVYCHRHVARDRNLNEIRLLIIHTLESLLKLSKPEEEKFVICFDLSKFTLACMDYEVVKELVAILQANYPETLFVCLIIDSPMIFSACWALIRSVNFFCWK